MQAAAGRPLEYYLCPSVNASRAPFGTYLQPSQFLSLLTTSRNQDLGAKFINFFVNDLEANRILLAERGIPAPTNVREDLGTRVDSAMRYTFDFISRVTPFASPIDPPAPDAVDEMRDMTRPIVLQCYTGRLSSDAAMTQLVNTANQILRQ
jgi:multiple sugar transport system substrate-binding protein